MNGRPALALAALLGAAFMAYPLLLDRASLEWGKPGEAALADWRQFVDKWGPERPQGELLQSVTLTYPAGTQTAVSVQVNSAGLSNVGLAEDVTGLLHRAYGGKPPASARYREEWTAGRVQRDGNGINLCFHALRASLPPEGAPQGGRSMVTFAKPVACPPPVKGAGGHGMSFRSLPLRLDEWNTLFIGRVSEGHSGEPENSDEADEWAYAVAIYPSSQPLLHEHQHRAELSLDAQAGEPVSLPVGGSTVPPVPGLAELRERLY